ncbi:MULTISPECIES: enterobactin synthase subunit EntD [Citrobacter]|uniref:enterobactin synthase subunit EntD n=1 Tax=Citrobacter TaxID=544 RepID=UPI000E3D85C9|nr:MULTISPECIES: enterobactin synthase subunit EntD [Citrobacter]MBD0826057.1 enterobactin synthase subunit EntD [Citrobacter sp. C1]RFU92777.1 enterobactin synthase subunit EntD [Citrobacter gillenii]
MHTTHIPLSFASHTLHLVEFAPDSLHEHDLLWLPHYAQLAACGRKRQAEHLAGRIAAVHALREYSSKAVPAIGERRQPLWPPGLFGSISHSASTALAVVSPRPIGLDIDAIFTPDTAAELADSIIDHHEQQVLQGCPVPFPLALTLAFSAKESVYKAFSAQTRGLPGFASAKIIALTATHLTVQIMPSFSANLGGLNVNVRWTSRDNSVITLCDATF